MADLADISMLTDEQIGTYKRAFIDNRADYIMIDGWSKPWMREDLAQMLPLGLLVYCPDRSERNSDEQYTAACYRPSEGFLNALKETNPNTETLITRLEAADIDALVFASMHKDFERRQTLRAESEASDAEGCV